MNIILTVIILNLIFKKESIVYSVPVNEVHKKISPVNIFDGILGLHKCKMAKAAPLDLRSLPEEFLRCFRDLRETKGKKHPLIGKNVTEILKFYGYKGKEYFEKIETEDGYLLTIQRIFPGKNGGKEFKPVLLMHGMGGCADNWIFNGPTESLAFILANLGYDVWLGNNRGSTYSQGHKDLTTDDLKYWDFSWHEMGIYDLPAFIKFIKKETKAKEIYYVGHSEGTSQFLVGGSTSPGDLVVNGDNIKKAFLMAPAGFIGKANNPIRFLSPVGGSNLAENLGGKLFQGRIEGDKKLLRFIGREDSLLGTACSPTATLCLACEYAAFAINGYDAPLMNYTNVPHLLDKFPNVIPFKCVVHYAQLINSCKFRQFDYGEEENRRKYGGRSTPPDYQLKNINVPTYFFYGDMDTDCVPDDVIFTANQFRKDFRKDVVRVKSQYFGHNSFVIAKNVKELVYDQIVKWMDE